MAPPSYTHLVPELADAGANPILLIDAQGVGYVGEEGSRGRLGPKSAAYTISPASPQATGGPPEAVRMGTDDDGRCVFLPGAVEVRRWTPDPEGEHGGEPFGPGSYALEIWHFPLQSLLRLFQHSYEAVYPDWDDPNPWGVRHLDASYGVDEGELGSYNLFTPRYNVILFAALALSAQVPPDWEEWELGPIRELHGRWGSHGWFKTLPGWIEERYQAAPGAEYTEDVAGAGTKPEREPEIVEAPRVSLLEF